MSVPEAMNNNLYQQRRNLAQGMMDISLILGNTAELRYILDAGSLHPYYYLGVAMIGFSILLQIAVGIGLIMINQQDIANMEHAHRANRINNYILIAVFLIIITNVFISGFIIAKPQDTEHIYDITLDEFIRDKPEIQKPRVKEEL